MKWIVLIVLVPILGNLLFGSSRQMNRYVGSDSQGGGGDDDDCEETRPWYWCDDDQNDCFGSSPCQDDSWGDDD